MHIAGGKDSARRRPSVRSVFLLGLAALLLVASLVLSQWSQSRTDPRFLELSMVPLPLNAGDSADAAKIGIRNVSPNTVDILLRVTQGRDLLLRVVLPHLGSGGSWQHTIERDPTERLTATVSLSSNPSKIVRHVYLDAKS